jgi:hypothetical protein
MDFESTWWRLFQESLVHTKLDVYDAITIDY